MQTRSNLVIAGLLALRPCGSSPTDLIIGIALAIITLALLILGILFHLGVSDFQQYED